MKVIWSSSFSLLLSEADFLRTIIFLCDPRTLFSLVISHIHYWMYQVINKNDSELIFLALEHLPFLALHTSHLLWLWFGRESLGIQSQNNLVPCVAGSQAIFHITQRKRWSALCLPSGTSVLPWGTAPPGAVHCFWEVIGGTAQVWYRKMRIATPNESLNHIDHVFFSLQ